MANNESFIVKSVNPDRLYVKVYHDFLDSELLDRNEKMVFILLKRYLDFRTDINGIEGQAYPTLETLSRQCGMSKGAVIRTIQSLKKKELIEVDQRGLNLPNIYTIKDYASIWKSGTDEELKLEIKNQELQRAKKIAEEYGYKLIKKKELESEPAKEQSQALEFNQYDIVNTTLNHEESQYLERYTFEQIKEYFDYSIMLHDYTELEDDINSVISILHSVLNSTKPTIRVGGEDKPSMVVTSKLMKLTYNSIIYAIKKYNAITERIINPTSYMLTILYNAEEQMNLDVSNQVQHDLHHPNK